MRNFTLVIDDEYHRLFFIYEIVHKYEIDYFV